MKSVVWSVCVCVAATMAAVPSSAQDVPGGFEFPQPQKEHEWLKQLVGEWETEAEMTIQPGAPPQTCTGTSRIRPLGGFWIIADNQADFFGMKIEAIMTLGYDQKQKKYIGTYVDNHMDYLWQYNGWVSDDGKTLTLEAEGPRMDGGEGNALYRDAFEVKSRDHIVMTSSMKMENGEWVQFVTTDFRATNREE